MNTGINRYGALAVDDSSDSSRSATPEPQGPKALLPGPENTGVQDLISEESHDLPGSDSDENTVADLFQYLEREIDAQNLPCDELQHLRDIIKDLRLELHNRWWCTQCDRGTFTGTCDTQTCRSL